MKTDILKTIAIIIAFHKDLRSNRQKHEAAWCRDVISLCGSEVGNWRAMSREAVTQPPGIARNGATLTSHCHVTLSKHHIDPSPLRKTRTSQKKFLTLGKERGRCTSNVPVAVTNTGTGDK